MMSKNEPRALVGIVSEAAASASERLIPPAFRGVLDRTLVDVACVTSGGVAAVARELTVDVPAVDAWRAIGVPTEFRGRLTALAVWPSRPTWRIAA